jgi:DNA cross-link repair 1A protein
MASQVESIKWVPGTRFIVDGFRFQAPEKCSRYFLTHCHSDHTTGLTRYFSSGLIYCSYVSYRLLIQDLKIRQDVLRPLELDRPVIIDGIEVTPICANHCPGAVCFLFRVPSTEPGVSPTVILHTGDFRWCSIKHGQHPALKDGVDILMLDTTYLKPKWTFPPQEEVVSLMAHIMRIEAEENKDNKTLFVCSSYHIGKERAYLGAAKILNWKVWVPKEKRKVLNILDLPREWMALLTENEYDAQIHVYSSKDDVHEQALADRIANSNNRWTKVMLFRPTGWTYKPSKGTNLDPNTIDRREEGCVTIIGVPYSEHSSYTELQDCVKTLRPRKLIPTVNAGDAMKRRALVDSLCGLMDLSEDKTRLDSYFNKGNNGGGKEEEDGGSGSGGGRLQEKEEEEHLVDLSSVDIEEQKRLFEQAMAAAEKARSQGASNPTGSTSAKKKNGGSQQGSSKRGSILSYFSKPAS